MEIFKNIAVNLKATGPAAVLIALILSIAGLGMFGEGELAKSALSILAVIAGMIAITLAHKSGPG